MWPDDIKDDYTLEEDADPWGDDAPTFEPSISWREVRESVAWEKGLTRAANDPKPIAGNKGKPTPRKPSGDVLFD